MNRQLLHEYRKIVQWVYNREPEEVDFTSRSEDIAMPRLAIRYFLYQIREWTYPDIAEAESEFKGSKVNHTTIRSTVLNHHSYLLRRNDYKMIVDSLVTFYGVDMRPFVSDLRGAHIEHFRTRTPSTITFYQLRGLHNGVDYSVITGIEIKYGGDYYRNFHKKSLDCLRNQHSRIETATAIDLIYKFNLVKQD